VRRNRTNQHSPGTYTFACSPNNEVSGTCRAALNLNEAHFYQTLCSICCCDNVDRLVLVRCASACCAPSVSSMRLGERNRIAREIHDTLAQGYVAYQSSLSTERASAPEQGGSGDKALNTTRSYVREDWTTRGSRSGAASQTAAKHAAVQMRRIVEQAVGRLDAHFSIYARIAR